MLSAEALTEVVASTTAPLLYHGVSDHVPHAQSTEIYDAGNKLAFLLVTFNVLNPAYMYYQNGVPPPGMELPPWLKMEDQAGLEYIPASNPKRQNERLAIIASAIKSLFREHRSVVCCIQECGSALYSEIAEFAGELGVAIFTGSAPADTNYCVTLVSNSLKWNVVDCSKKSISVELPDGRAVVHNVHMEFNTAATMDMIKHCFQLSNGKHCIVAGDFNVQTKPLSKAVLEEGICTATLTELCNALQATTAVKPLFALHPQKWTNWNVRKNCADRASNWDHFDNIMLMSSEPTSVKMTAVDFPVTMM